MIDHETLFDAVLIEHSLREARLNRDDGAAVRPTRSSIRTFIAAMLMGLSRFISDQPAERIAPVRPKVASEA